MWISRDQYETLEATILDLSRRVADLGKEVNGNLAYYDYFGVKVDSRLSLRKYINLLMEHFDLEYKEGHVEPDKLVKVKK